MNEILIRPKLDPNAKSLRLCEKCGRTPILNSECHVCLRTLLDESLAARIPVKATQIVPDQQLLCVSNVADFERFVFSRAMSAVTKDLLKSGLVTIERKKEIGTVVYECSLTVVKP